MLDYRLKPLFLHFTTRKESETAHHKTIVYLEDSSLINFIKRNMVLWIAVSSKEHFSNNSPTLFTTSMSSLQSDGQRKYSPRISPITTLDTLLQIV